MKIHSVVSENSSGNFLPLRGVAAMLLASSIVGFSSSASAQTTPLPSAPYTGYAFDPTGEEIASATTTGDISIPYQDPLGPSALTTFSSTPTPTLAYQTNVNSPPGEWTMLGGGTLIYTFEVDSAAPNAEVPVNFQGLFSSSAEIPLLTTEVGNVFSFLISDLDVDHFSQAGFDLTYIANCGNPPCLTLAADGPNVQWLASGYMDGDLLGSFEGTLSLLADGQGHALGYVSLGLRASVFVTGGFSSAYIDPYLSIDPAYLAAHPGVRLVLPPGVGNGDGSVTPVPEPETYALMLAGLAAMALKSRGSRRRRQR